MTTILRHLVSKKKKRYIDKHYDLDLTYITDRIIAMGYPCENYERYYRNPASNIKKFLDERHKNHYKVWNLCAELKRTYDAKLFHGRVEFGFGFYDHEAPKWSSILPFCKSVDAWLKENDKNVAVIHCKAGKGRTGVMISAYLLYTKLNGCVTAAKAMDFYAEKRTKNRKGVMIPSQRRYVLYLEKSLSQWKGAAPYPGQKLSLISIKLSPPPLGGNSSLSFEVYNDKLENIFTLGEFVKYKQEDKSVVIEVGKFFQECILQGDVKIVIKKKKKKGLKTVKKKICHFWFSTEFVEDYYLLLHRNQIDKACKDKKYKKFRENFCIECNFEDPNPEMKKLFAPVRAEKILV